MEDHVNQLSEALRNVDIGSYTEMLRAMLKSQYHAALAMLRETIISATSSTIWHSWQIVCVPRPV